MKTNTQKRKRKSKRQSWNYLTLSFLDMTPVCRLLLRLNVKKKPLMIHVCWNLPNTTMPTHTNSTFVHVMEHIRVEIVHGIVQDMFEPLAQTLNDDRWDPQGLRSKGSSKICQSLHLLHIIRLPLLRLTCAFASPSIFVTLILQLHGLTDGSPTSRARPAKP